MFRIFWMDIDENVTGHRDYWDVNELPIIIRMLPDNVRVYRVQNIMPTREEIIRRQFIGVA